MAVNLKTTMFQTYFISPYIETFYSTPNPLITYKQELLLVVFKNIAPMNYLTAV